MPAAQCPTQKLPLVHAARQARLLTRTQSCRVDLFTCCWPALRTGFGHRSDDCLRALQKHMGNTETGESGTKVPTLAIDFMQPVSPKGHSKEDTFFLKKKIFRPWILILFSFSTLYSYQQYLTELTLGNMCLNTKYNTKRQHKYCRLPLTRNSLILVLAEPNTQMHTSDIETNNKDRRIRS